MKTRSLLMYAVCLLVVAVGASFLPLPAGADYGRIVNGGAVSAAAARDTVIAYARPGSYFTQMQLTSASTDTLLTEPYGLKVWVSMNGSDWDSVASVVDTVTAILNTTYSSENVYITIPRAPIVRFTCPNTGVWVCNADSVVMYPLLLEVQSD